MAEEAAKVLDRHPEAQSKSYGRRRRGRVCLPHSPCPLMVASRGCRAGTDTDLGCRTDLKQHRGLGERWRPVICEAGTRQGARMIRGRQGLDLRQELLGHEPSSETGQGAAAQG